MRTCFLLFSSLLLLMSILPPGASAAEPPPTNSCRVCHSDQAVEYSKSIHQQAQIECVDCHGGDPSILDEKSMAPATGFKQKPDKKGIVELCGSCHSDARMMTPYGLPIDEYALYRTSVHGTRLYEEGDSNVAVCTDCHGSHGILSPTDPESPVYPSNVPATCARCHADRKLMSRYGIPTDQYEKYKGSVHGKALLEQGLTGVPTCATCHGTHGATPPGVRDISNVCGQCHTNTRTYFNESPHKRAMDLLGMKECTSCHGNHAIQKPTLAMFDTVCADCHEDDSEELQRGQQFKNLILKVEDELKQTEQLVEETSGRGLYTQGYKLMLDEARTNLVQVVPVLHTLSTAKIESILQRALDTAQSVRNSIDDYYASLRVRKFALGVLWGFLILSIVLIAIRIHRANREWEMQRQTSSASERHEDGS